MPDQPKKPDQPEGRKQPEGRDRPEGRDQADEQTGRPGVPSRPGGEPSEEEREQFRQPNFWRNEKDRETSFRMEDKRWARSEQIKDWLKLLILVILTLAWHLTVYFLEPGMR